MSYADDLKRFTTKVETNTRDVFVSMATMVHGSIKDGSSITGAPGQPVDTEHLKGSWILRLFKAHAVVQTNVLYAPFIEEGMILARSGQVTGQTGQRLTLRSKVGGFHSVKLTMAGANRLLAVAVRELA